MEPLKYTQSSTTFRKITSQNLSDSLKPYMAQPKFHIPLKKLRGRSPQANYTDRATAACRRS
jgi:hypothetical protein